ncbi:MAG: ATP-binding protein [Mariprofundaceae bacterium]|nr:ATP-binding protein [Mariprofundaceae bacterium]
MDCNSDSNNARNKQPLKRNQVDQLNFQLNTQPDCVHILRAMVEVMAARSNLTDMETNRVALAVDELFANITCHGYNNKPGSVTFESHLQHNEDGLQELHFTFRDYAPTVNISHWNCGKSKPCHDLDITPGGLGIRLIHSIMDVVQHEALHDGNQWTLIYVCKHAIKRGRP